MNPTAPLSMITVPDTLVAVAMAGYLGKQSFSAGMMTYRWAVKNPINNYNIVPYIGKYVQAGTKHYNGEKGKLDCELLGAGL